MPTQKEYTKFINAMAPLLAVLSFSLWFFLASLQVAKFTPVVLLL